jgi:hypothetical protein
VIAQAPNAAAFASSIGTINAGRHKRFLPAVSVSADGFSAMEVKVVG